MIIREASDEDIPIFEAIFRDAYRNSDHVPEEEFVVFQKELHAAFDKTQLYRILFFALEKDDVGTVSFAGIAPCMFMDGGWELRWGTTAPDFQRQGCMNALTHHRIEYARRKNGGMPGLIQIAARYPDLYKKLGFKQVFERNIENYAVFLVKEI